MSNISWSQDPIGYGDVIRLLQGADYSSIQRFASMTTSDLNYMLC